MAKKRITLSDIARELNVSVGLVSLVLSGKGKENRIGEDITKKVIAKASEMGYQVNVMARGLRTGKSGIIGLVVADIANPYFGRMARSVENEAAKLGYQVMFASSDEDPEKLSSILNVFRSRQVDGLLVVPVENSSECIKGINSLVPTVFVDRLCDGLDEDVVCTNNSDGAIQLTNVLINKGYKKIAAFVYNLQLSNNKERIEGYKEALLCSDNITQEPMVFEIDFENVKENLRQALNSALEQGCDALFFANNNLGIESLKILREKDDKLPFDLGIVSFDNPEAFQVSNPTVTCFEQSVEQICTQAISILTQKIEKEFVADSASYYVSGRLIMRESH